MEANVTDLTNRFRQLETDDQTNQVGNVVFCKVVLAIAQVQKFSLNNEDAKDAKSSDLANLHFLAAEVERLAEELQQRDGKPGKRSRRPVFLFDF